MELDFVVVWGPGVGQNPLSLALELAPMGSLRGIIQKQRQQLNPLVSQTVARQV